MTTSEMFLRERLNDRTDNLRDRFLNNPTQQFDNVRPVIARSWFRSHAAGVDAFVDRGFQETGRVDEHTLTASSVHLRKLDEFAADLGGYVDLTAPNGSIVRPEFLRESDEFPEGYSLLEESCGSNGEGLALEEGRGVWLAPEEHFRQDMRNNWCFATLIRDPFHNRVRGVVGLTLPQDKVPGINPASTMLMLEGVASRIEQEIAARTSAKERALLHEYLTIAKRRSDVSVVAMDGKNSLMNNTAMSTLEDQDLAVLSGYAKSVMSSGKSAQFPVELQGAGLALLEVTAVSLPGSSYGAIVVAKPQVTSRKDLPSPTQVRAAALEHDIAMDLRKTLDGVGPEFDAMLTLAAKAIARQQSVAIIGETGSGKRRIAAAMGDLSGSWTELDARRVDSVPVGFRERLRAAIGEDPRILLLSHADELSLLDALEVCRQLGDAKGTRLAFTATRHTNATLRIAESCRALEIPTVPLRSRREDISVLANSIAEELGDRRLSRYLLAELTNADWPRNIEQLRGVVTNAVERANGSEVTIDDLPSSFQAGRSAGRLSRLEEVELAELRAALRETKGNRRMAAEMLEIGRSTLYRRMDFFRSRGFDL